MLVSQKRNFSVVIFRAVAWDVKLFNSHFYVESALFLASEGVILRLVAVNFNCRFNSPRF